MAPYKFLFTQRTIVEIIIPDGKSHNPSIKQLGRLYNCIEYWYPMCEHQRIFYNEISEEVPLQDELSFYINQDDQGGAQPS